MASNDTVTINEDTIAVIPILANDSDPDGDALVAQLLSQPQNGQATLSGTNVTYQPQLNFNGTNSFTYKITDTLGSSATGLVTVIVLPVNDPPTANNAVFSQPADTISTNTLSGADVDSSNLVFFISSSPLHGVATLNPTTGNLIYRPVHGFFGADSLRFQVFDGQANSAEATVSITVIAPTDVDHDGMADAWENLWDLNDPNADPDHDGFTSLQEYLANTNPRDEKSFFHILSVVPDADGYWHVTWASVGGTRYRVYSTDSLTNGAAYQPILRSVDEEMDPSPYGAASSQTYIDMRPASVTGARFYRIAVVQ